MTQKEERLESFNWSTQDYIKQIKEKVITGDITAKDAGYALGLIAKLMDVTADLIKSYINDDEATHAFVCEQLQLNEILNSGSKEKTKQCECSAIYLDSKEICRVVHDRINEHTETNLYTE